MKHETELGSKTDKKAIAAAIQRYLDANGLARKDLIRIYGKNPDYMAGMSEEQKKARLAKISYQDYLLNIAKISPDAVPFFLGQGGRNSKHVDTMPAAAGR